jgi:hypothetical protein
MSYYIDIIDKLSPLTKLELRTASAGGLVLSWNGADAKDDLSIVASHLSFDMHDPEHKDAAYIDMFTGDEERFLVQLKDSVSDVIYWQGHVLPDLYEEPYTNSALFVRFTAVCGLSRLKGKYLPDAFYSEEKSLIEIYSQILKLTSLNFDLYFAPAIENFVNKDWNTIYIDTLLFQEKNKKKDAYKILEQLLNDTLCVCYQANNRWYIEGLNMRMKRSVEFSKYNPDGVFVAKVTESKLLKQVTPFVDPTITIVPPYNEITVTHEKIEPAFPATIAKEKNDGWAIVTGVDGKIIPDNWMGHNSYYPEAKNPNYEVAFYNKAYVFGQPYSIVYTQDDTSYISLKEKLFLDKKQKVKFSLEFTIIKPNGVTEPPSNRNLWRNPFKYEILLNGVVLFGNFKASPGDNEIIQFEDSGSFKTEMQHIVTEESLLDIRLYHPTNSINVSRILGITINKLEVEIIGFQEEEIVTDIINGDFTVDKTVELEYSDDKSGFSKGFRLKKLRNETTFFNEFTVPILYNFSLNSKNYAVVQLKGAVLIADNLYQVYHSGALVEILSVSYNFNDNEQMVIETENLLIGNFVVRKYAVDDTIDSRKHWLQWTDAFYKIENERYAQIVANINRRMFNEAAEKIEMTVNNVVKFNDMILFKYQFLKDYIVTNCEWNLNTGYSSILLNRSIYKDATSTNPDDQNIPPIVLAGDDIYLTNSQTETTFNATAYDPDGFIVSQIWEKLEGDAGDVIAFPASLNTGVSGLTGNRYVYKVTVTDNDGATASDTLAIYREIDYLLALEFVNEIDDSADLINPKHWITYRLKITPALLPNMVLSLTGLFESFVYSSNIASGYDAYTGYVITKNGVDIESIDIIDSTMDIPITLGFISTDEILFTIKSESRQGAGGPSDTATATMNLKINTATFLQGNGVISGLPLLAGVTTSVTGS